MSDGSLIPPTAPFPLDVASFRTLFAQFADPAQYPDAGVQAWLNQAFYYVNCAWGPQQGWGQGLWAAHELAKLAMAATAAKGGNPLGITGIISSKSVGPVSVSYDTSLGTVEGAGQYNLTLYGRQYYQNALLFGAGPMVSDPTSPAPPFSGPAWYGPPFYIPGW